MDVSSAVAFDHLSGSDLVLDRVYKGGTAKGAAADPLTRLLPGVGNQGGFRAMGSTAKDTIRLVVLYTSGAEPDWPDELDPYTGAFTYFGDNRSPGRELHDTPRKGNLLLRSVFERAHGGPAERAKVPPFLLFDKPGTGRDVRFRGLLAPGSDRTSGEEDLVAVWRTTQGQRFQNYRARFTVLDAGSVTRSWIEELSAGKSLGPSCPPAWRSWTETGRYLPLQAPPTVIVRRRDEQEPLPADKPLLNLVYQHFKDRPTDFEQFAADLWRASQPKVDLTRPWRDGGRDAVGDYLLGPRADPVAVEFALEAKCYAPRQRRRRPRPRNQPAHLPAAPPPVRRPGHHIPPRQPGLHRDPRRRPPVIVLAARDIANILKTQGLNTPAQLQQHLTEKHPPR